MQQYNWENLSLVKGLSTRFYKSLFDAAIDFYESAPWRQCDADHVVEIAAFGQTRVFQLNGRNGMDIGILQWVSFHQFWMIHCPDSTITEAVLRHPPVGLDYLEPSDIIHENRKFYKRNQLAKTADGLYPNFNLYLRKSPLTVLEMKFFDIALQVLPVFYHKDLKRKGPYDFEPITITKTVYCNALAKEISVRVKYPAGKIDYPSQRFVYPFSETIKTLLPIPTSIKTKRDAVEYFRSICGRAGLFSRSMLETFDNRRLKKHLTQCGVPMIGCLEKRDFLDVADLARPKKGQYGSDYTLRVMGFAYCLNELRTLKSTEKCLDLCWQILHEGDDILNIRIKMIDVYLETFQYNNVLRVMKQFPDDTSTEFFWTVALLQYKKRGGASTVSIDALKDAVFRNSFVVKYISKECAVPVDEELDDVSKLSEEIDRAMRLRNGLVGSDPVAIAYAASFFRHWNYIEGACEWVAHYGKQHMEDLRKESLNPKYKCDCRLINDPAGCTHAPIICPELEIPDILINCECCSKCDDVKLKRCAECRLVAYCSKECQKEDWQRHKEKCKGKDASKKK